MKVKILITGGTIDKSYNMHNGELHFVDSHIPSMLVEGRCKVALEIDKLMLKDSLDMTDSDRLQIVSSCQQTRASRIIITHGTDTLEVTARALGPEISDKTVVLVGAMIPYTFGSSDGLFNLGSALAYAQTLPPGVYVAMNGRCHVWSQVRKNKQTGVFEHVSPSPST